jgi:hypothetical protein
MQNAYSSNLYNVQNSQVVKFIEGNNRNLEKANIKGISSVE